MPTVERFEDLRAWQEAREIVRLVYRLTEKFPPSEQYGLASQMRRAAASTMSNTECLKQTPVRGPKVREPGPVWHLEEPETWNHGT